ncbi:MAG: hypothetical protein HC801_05220 [Nitrospira sp.]|nr:hypothetical protein [Nitrospira sp.]
MTRPFILALSQCTDLDLAGGKAVGLAQLIAAGFSVPHGVCLTTEAYRQILHASGFIDHEMWAMVHRLTDNKRGSALARCRDRIKGIEITQLASQWQTTLETLRRPPSERWAVRSSATNEDATQTSFAGLYRTHLGVALSDIEAAIKDLWTSLWEERVINYMAQQYRVTPLEWQY